MVSCRREGVCTRSAKYGSGLVVLLEISRLGPDVEVQAGPGGSRIYQMKWIQDRSFGELFRANYEKIHIPISC